MAGEGLRRGDGPPRAGTGHRPAPAASGGGGGFARGHPGETRGRPAGRLPAVHRGGLRGHGSGDGPPITDRPGKRQARVALPHAGCLPPALPVPLLHGGRCLYRPGAGAGDGSPGGKLPLAGRGISGMVEGLPALRQRDGLPGRRAERSGAFRGRIAAIGGQRRSRGAGDGGAFHAGSSGKRDGR